MATFSSESNQSGVESIDKMLATLHYRPVIRILPFRTTLATLTTGLWSIVEETFCSIPQHFCPSSTWPDREVFELIIRCVCRPFDSFQGKRVQELALFPPAGTPRFRSAGRFVLHRVPLIAPTGDSMSAETRERTSLPSRANFYLKKKLTELSNVRTIVNGREMKRLRPFIRFLTEKFFGPNNEKSKFRPDGPR